MAKKILLIYLIFLLTTEISVAQPLVESDATPSVISEPGATIMIKEINFKNSTYDWVKIFYNSPTNKTLNLKNISFADDSTFKTISENLFIAPGQELLLSFKNDLPDQIPYLYTPKDGLTGTTEQFIIYDNNNNVLDAVCWTSKSPTEKEIADIGKLYELEGWHSPDISSCIKSEEIKTDESLIRVGTTDTNSISDWISELNLYSENDTSIPDEPKTEIQPITEVEYFDMDTESLSTDIYNIPLTKINSEQTTEIEVPIVSVVDLNPDKSPKKDQSNVQASTLTKKTTSPSYTNGNLSNEIIISEVMPNPDGTDSKKEWIELHNIGDNEINLGNWTIDDSEDGSKPYLIPSTITIGPNQSILLESKDTKISLGNSEDEVRLFDFTETLIDSINYESAPSGESYAQIQIIKEDKSTENEWIWTPDPTPGLINASYSEIIGVITQEPQFESKYFFEIEDSNNTPYTIEFSEDLIAGPLAKASFIQGSTIKLLIEPIENTQNEYKLKKFEILESAKSNSKNELIFPSIIIVLLIIGASAFYLLQKKIPWQDIKESLNKKNE